MTNTLSLRISHILNLALALLLFAFITGCSAGKQSEQLPDTPDIGSNNETRIIGHSLTYDTGKEVNDGQPITLEFWGQIDYEDIYRQLINDYEEIHPNVDIILYSASWNDHVSSLNTSLESELGPDIMHLHSSFASKLLHHLQPYPRSIFPLETLERDFRQVRSHITDGQLYFIDTGLMTGAILYNLQHWQEAGLDESDIPRTWDDLYQVARILTRRDENGSTIRSGFNPNGMGFALLVALNYQQGMPMFDPDDPRDPLIATAASRRSLSFIRSLYEEPAVVDVYMPEAHESLAFGSASMIYAWGWVLNWIENNGGISDYASFPLPTWDGEIPPAYDRNNGELSMGVSRYSDPAKQAVAFDFLKYYLASDNHLLEVSGRFGAFPSKRSLEDNSRITENKNLEAYSAILERTIWPGAFPLMYEEHIIRYVIDPVILDGADIDTALEVADRVITPIMRYEDFISREGRYEFSGLLHRGP